MCCLGSFSASEGMVNCSQLCCFLIQKSHQSGPHLVTLVVHLNHRPGVAVERSGEIVPPPPVPAPAPAGGSTGSVKARPASCRALPVSVSTQEIQTESSLASRASQASINSLQSGEVELESSNGDLCKGGYGYRFDFRSSCEFDFTEDVYI